MKRGSRRPAGNRSGGTGKRTTTTGNYITHPVATALSRAALTNNALDAHGTQLACLTDRLRALAWRRDDGALARDALAACDVAMRWHRVLNRRTDLIAQLVMVERDIASMYVGTWASAIALGILLDALERHDDGDDTPLGERDTPLGERDVAGVTLW